MNQSGRHLSKHSFGANGVPADSISPCGISRAACFRVPRRRRPLPRSGLRPRYARPWFRSGVIGGGSTGVSFPVVAFATIRPRRVSRGRHWWCVEGLFWLCRARESGCEASGLSHSLRGRRSRFPTTEKKTPAPPSRARWGIVREASPYSSQLGRCSPLWRALRAIARQSGYPRFARLAIGRGAAAFGARQSLFKRLANSAFPAPRGECESSPQSRLNCALHPR